MSLHEGVRSLVRVLVVDDHPAFRRALTSALEMVDGIDVAGEAGGGEAACQEVEHLRPDLVLMDLSMPDLSGIDATRRIHRRQPELPVVILTSSKEESDLIRGYELHANSYIRKPVEFERFIEAVKEIGLYWLVLNESPPAAG